MQPRVLAVLVVSSFLLAACVEGSEGGGQRDDGPPPDAGNRPAARVALSLRNANDKPNALMAAGAMQSFKVFVREISICGVSRQGFSRCERFYEGPPNSPLSATGPVADLSTLADAARAETDGYVDLIDPASRARLTKDITITEPAVFRTASVGYFPGVKVKAELSDASGTPVFFTHDGRVDCSPSRNIPVGGQCTTISTVPFTEAPAEEALMMISTGGNTFDFQTPFEVTQEDIDNGASFRIDLAFDPDGLAQGTTCVQSPCDTVLRDGAANGMQAVWPTMVPVPYVDGQKLVREKYLGVFTDEASHFDIRLELFSVVEDPQRNVRGVSCNFLQNATSNGNMPAGGRINSLAANADGTLNFFGDGQHLFIENFKRGQQQGDTADATVHVCVAGACPRPMRFELLAVDELE